MKNVFSIDLEDWFHLLDNESAPSKDSWQQQESRVRSNTERLLKALETHKTRCTFFVLGWIADQHPQLIAEIAASGHEIASHGYWHTLVYNQTEERFRADLRLANDAIDRAAGRRPIGYRAPGFSIKHENLWAFDILKDEGFTYDSSSFPAIRAHGGLPGTAPDPTVLINGLLEFPISTASLGIMRAGYLGGGYLRLLPQKLILHLAKRQERAGRPLIAYLHPRDIDPHQPRLNLSRTQHFRTYVGLDKCLDKVIQLLTHFEWTSFANAIHESSLTSPSIIGPRQPRNSHAPFHD